MLEREFDKRLHIQTAGTREWIHQSAHYNRYEATPYEAMDYLFAQHSVITDGSWIDFGCGKGRVPFYVHAEFLLDTVGIEMNHVLYQDAMNNLMAYRQAFPKRTASITFECCLAEQYEIPSDAATFYFFNPFSIDVFRTVIRHIEDSLERFPRQAEVILYYPTNDYEEVLQERSFLKIAEIPVEHLHLHDWQERFVVYRPMGKCR